MTGLGRAKRLLSSALWNTLGRKRYARLGRFLWMQSRLDMANDMRQNGERLLQGAFAAHAAAATDGARRLCVFDVGANVGGWSAQLLGELERRAVSLDGLALHLFEPAPAARAALNQRLASYPRRLGEMHISAEAVADQVAEATLSLFSDTAGTNTLRTHTGESIQDTLAVACTTLDAYCEARDIQHIDLVKIDTEGNDYNVLAGAAGLLAAQRISAIQFEYNHRWIAFRHYLKDVFDLVQGHGYTVGKVTPRGIERYREWHHELESFREGNYLIWTPPLPWSLPSIRWWNE